MTVVDHGREFQGRATEELTLQTEVLVIGVVMGADAAMRDRARSFQ